MLLEKVISVVAAAAALLEGSMNASLPEKNMAGNIFLVNRQNAISQYYVPSVRKVNGPGMSQSMRDDAATALEEMFAAAKAEGINLAIVSGYRSYTKQASIYSRKKASVGQKEADRVSARPGTSEHQLGLAMDLARKGSSQLNSSFGKTKEGQWVKENAHRFGFIVRYLENYEEVTGYMYEPWHVRYVGTEYAQAIYESTLPVELFLTDYKLKVYDFLIHQDANEVSP